jgi:hypothetical protein
MVSLVLIFRYIQNITVQIFYSSLETLGPFVLPGIQGTSTEDLFDFAESFVPWSMEA